jgi:hypothetical protein
MKFKNSLKLVELFLDFGVLYIEEDKSAEKSAGYKGVKNLLQKKTIKLLEPAEKERRLQRSIEEE